MKVKIRTEGYRFTMPVPLALIGFVVKRIPESVFDKARANTPVPYQNLISKEYVSMVLEECLDFFKENKGLEIIHVEAQDGTFVSIRI